MSLEITPLQQVKSEERLGFHCCFGSCTFHVIQPNLLKKHELKSELSLSLSEQLLKRIQYINAWPLQIKLRTFTLEDDLN